MKKIFTVKNIAVIAIFTALSAILYCVPGLQFSLGFAPNFLKIHFDEIPVLICSFSYGPVVGLIVHVLKCLIKLPMDMNNMCIGVLADFFYGLFLFIPASLIYKYHRNIKGAIVGLSIGLILNIIVSGIIGLYTIFPLYEIVYGDFVLNSFKAFDSSINSLYDFKVAYEFLIPFNCIRAGIVTIVTFLVYKPLKSLINRNYN